MTPTLTQLKHGTKVRCKIAGKLIKDAKLSICDNEIFICQDEKDGCHTKDRLGYLYSWSLSSPTNDEELKENLHDNEITDLEIVAVETIEENQERKNMTELTVMQKMFLPKNTQILIEEGYLNSDLSLTPKAQAYVQAKGFADVQDALVEEIVAERKAEEAKKKKK